MVQWTITSVLGVSASIFLSVNQTMIKSLH